MGAQPERNSARLLAPIALALVAVVFFALILSNGSGDTRKNDVGAKPSQTTTEKSKSRTPAATTYTIKRGDNLPAIARKTGLSVQKIQELNPALDPYNMQAGQKVNLRQ